MYKQKLTLDPKLAEICEATLTVCDAEPLQQETLEKAANFKVLGCSKLSEQEMNTHKLMRAATPLATGQKDVAVTELKCISVEGTVLPAEFQMHYVFHVANYSNEAIASVPVTIYFNTPDHALVEQGTTTVKNIPAGHYQALEFTFPGVVAGQWKMSMEANKPRAFEESNYANNLLSRTFTYVNKAELMAESVSALDSEPKYDSEGHQILYYDVPTTLEFVLSNVSAIDAKNVLVQVPAAFEDATGAHPAKLAETRMDVPAHTRRTLKLDITFNKPATAQIGLLINNDRACDEVSYDNNETHEIFSITKYNPGTGGETYIDIPTQKVVCQDGSEDVWVGLNPNERGNGNVEAFVACFKKAAKLSSSECLQLPVNMILAQWGIESLWGGYYLQVENQNWGNIIYSSLDNPIGNIGKGLGGWAKFEGVYKWAKGYAGYLMNSSHYSDLREYLYNCESGDDILSGVRCARILADSPYFEPTEDKTRDDYFNDLVGAMDSVNRYLS